MRDTLPSHRVRVYSVLLDHNTCSIRVLAIECLYLVGTRVLHFYPTILGIYNSKGVVRVLRRDEVFTLPPLDPMESYRNPMIPRIPLGI